MLGCACRTPDTARHEASVNAPIALGFRNLRRLPTRRIPTIFGITVAAYIERVGPIVRDLAGHWLFAAVAITTLLMVALPQTWGVRVPLFMPIGTQLFLDDTAVVAEPLSGDTIQFL